jgi:DNA-directed RNA polymerase specialized sigma24 family protein
VRLLETLVKAELPKGRKESGAPSRDQRETVVKLARQGWSAAEIARVTHLSRGEVELILELAPKTAG